LRNFAEQFPSGDADKTCRIGARFFFVVEGLKSRQDISIVEILLVRTFPVSTTMYWKVTLTRSGIGLPKNRVDTLVALGLRKRFRTVYKPVNPQIAGLLLRVKELIRVELVENTETKEVMKERRRPEKGYFVESMGSGYVKPVDMVVSTRAGV
jgi:large subunit ribosomal protein L30